MKKIYKCELSLIKNLSLTDVLLNNNTLSKRDYEITPLKYKCNLKDIIFADRGYIKDLITCEFDQEIWTVNFYLFNNKENSRTIKKIPEIFLDGTIYVTKTLIPNIVREITTGYYFYVVNNKAKKFNENMICVIKNTNIHNVLYEESLIDLKAYLINKNLIKRKIDLISDYSEKYYLKNVDICNMIKEKSEEIRSKDLEKIRSIKKDIINNKKEIKKLLK